MTSRSTIDNYSSSDMEVEVQEDLEVVGEVQDDVEAAVSPGGGQDNYALRISTIDIQYTSADPPGGSPGGDPPQGDPPGGDHTGEDAGDLQDPELPGGANPEDIPGNDYWADYWNQHLGQVEDKPSTDRHIGITPRGGTGTIVKRKLSRRKRIRKCIGLICMVVIIASVAISMLMFYSTKKKSSSSGTTKPPVKEEDDMIETVTMVFSVANVTASVVTT